MDPDTSIRTTGLRILLFSSVGSKMLTKYKFFSSVADPGCLSWIPDPDFYQSRIPDPKTAKKERGEKK